MREFRAKTTKKENGEHAFNNVWVEGDLVVSRDKYYIHPRANAFQVDNELAKLVVMHEVIPETVGQFVGITDNKNGKKIFEGDIVKGSKVRDIMIVVFSQSGCFIVVSCGGWWDFIDNIGEIEVIGNIIDNKELLDKGE